MHTETQTLCPDTPEIVFLLDAVRAAARLVAQVQASMDPASQAKADASPVTVADYGAQALVGHLLDRTFPADPLVGEEDSSSLREETNRAMLERIAALVGEHAPGATTEAVCRWIDRGSAVSGRRYWTVDPIDGTKGFLRGDQYAVALALVEDGQVRLGALGCPNLSLRYLRGEPTAPFDPRDGSLVAAVRGRGTWAAPLAGGEFVRLTVSDRSDPAQARVLRSLESGHTNLGQTGELMDHLKIQAASVGMDSQAKYAVLAAGKGDLLVRFLSAKAPDYQEKVWDQAAGSIVVEEAGGRISDLHGRNLDFTTGRTLVRNRGVLATNGRLHEALLEGMRAIGV